MLTQWKQFKLMASRIIVQVRISETIPAVISINPLGFNDPHV